ncbi:PAS domain-containing protein [bacterium]|nr:PAS domain-containing protein [bacterium]
MVKNLLSGAILFPFFTALLKFYFLEELLSTFETLALIVVGAFLGIIAGVFVRRSQRNLHNRIDLLTAKDTESNRIIDDFNEVVSSYKSEIENINEYLHNAIEENEKVKQILWESEERLSNAVTNAPIVLYILDDEHRFTFIQGNVLDSLGVKSGDIVGKLLSDVFPKSIGLQNGLEVVLKGGIFETEIKIRRTWLEARIIPQKNESGEIVGVVGVATDITDRKMAERQREKLIKELKQAISKIRILSGLVPICANCKKIRDDKGYWNQIEKYISEHSDAVFSHGICPDCAQKLYPELYNKKVTENAEVNDGNN